MRAGQPGSTPSSLRHLVAFFNKDFSSTVAARESSTGNYINPSKLDPDGGSVRFHILSDEPITGYELWFQRREDGKQVPRRSAAEPDAALIADLEADVAGTLVVRDGRPAINPFAAFFAYDYESDEVRVFSATQKTILRELDRLTSDPDYSDLSEWDVQITRNGKGMDTKYNVDFKPTKRRGAVAARITAAWDDAQANGADLGALFTGGSPFGSSAA